jgi:hypothetical protein
MKEITKDFRNYEMIVDSFELGILIEVEDDDYQGDSFFLLRDHEKYGILIFGWGSCSGCDPLDEICDSFKGSKFIEEMTKFRDDMYDSIVWRSREEIVEYISEKNFNFEWYGHSEGGRKFIKELKNYSF